MEKQIKEWLERHTEYYNICVTATVNNTPDDISASDTFAIATAIYNQANRAGLFRVEGDPIPRDSQEYLPATGKQLDFINTLCLELGKEASEIVDQQLRLCGKEHLLAITKQEATEIITILKAEKNRSK